MLNLKCVAKKITTVPIIAIVCAGKNIKCASKYFKNPDMFVHNVLHILWNGVSFSPSQIVKDSSGVALRITFFVILNGFIFTLPRKTILWIIFQEEANVNYKTLSIVILSEAKYLFCFIYQNKKYFMKKAIFWKKNTLYKCNQLRTCAELRKNT